MDSQKMIVTIVLMVIFSVLSGCAVVQPVMESSEEMIEATEDMVRSTDRLARSTERLSEQAGETGQKLRGLKKKQFNLELIKSSRLEDVAVRIRMVGTDNLHTLSADKFIRFKLPVSRFVDTATMSIYTEINGVGIPIKVRKEYFDDIQSGSTEILVLVETRDWFAWIPPSEMGQDREIIFSSN